MCNSRQFAVWNLDDTIHGYNILEFHKVHTNVNPRFSGFGIFVYLQFSLAPPPFPSLQELKALHSSVWMVTSVLPKLNSAVAYHKESWVLELPCSFTMPDTFGAELFIESSVLVKPRLEKISSKAQFILCTHRQQITLHLLLKTITTQSKK